MSEPARAAGAPIPAAVVPQLAAAAAQDPPEDSDWGELYLRSATPDTGSEWTDDGTPRERRQLKHRAEGDTRIVPTHPELTQLLRDHLAKFGTVPTADCSVACGAASCRRSPTGAPGSKRARRRSPRLSKPRRWRVGRMTFGMLACPRG